MAYRFVTTRSQASVLALVAVVLIVLAGCFNPTGSQDPVASPTFTPEAGVFAPPQSVSIASATEGASIRYTTDGSTPSPTEGVEYTGAISLSRSATIRAIAYKEGMADSDVADGEFALPKIYVARTADGEVTVIAGATGAILDTVTVGSNPVGIAVNPNTGRVWVANSGDNTVSVIDSETDLVLNTITSIPQPRQIAVNPDTNTVYVTANEVGIVDSVYPIDGSTDVVGPAIAVGENPDGIAVNTATNRVYVSHASSEDVYAINGATATVVVGPTAAGSQPEGVVVHESTDTVYVASNIDNTLEIFDGGTLASAGQVALGGTGAPWGIAINQQTGIVYVAVTDFPGTVRVVDTATDTETTFVSVGNNPYYVAVDESRNYVYVTSYDAKSVAVIDGSSNTVVDTIDLSAGVEPEGIAVMP